MILQKIYAFRYIAILGLLLGLVFGGLSCKSAHSARTVTLRLSTWGSATELLALKQVLKGFEAQHPGVSVSVLHMPENYAQKLQLLFAANLAPDVVFVNSYQFPLYAQYHLLRPMVVSALERADFYPVALRAFQLKAPHLKASLSVGAMPRDISSMVLFYNQDLFQKYGLTLPTDTWQWADFLNTGRQFVRQTQPQRPSAQSVYFMAFNPSSLYWLPFVWSAGGELFDAGTCRVLQLNNPKTRQGLLFYQQLQAQRLAAGSKLLGKLPAAQLFLDGRVLTMISGRWSVPLLREKAKFAWDVVPIPAGEAGSVTNADASGYAVTQASRHPQLAEALARFLTQPPALRQFAQSGLIIPARVSVNQSENLFRKAVFLSVLAQAKPTCVPTDWPKVSQQLAEQLEPVFDR